MPFGWVLVEPYNQAEELPEWPVKEYDNGASEWLEKTENTILDLSTKLQKRLKEEQENKVQKEIRQRKAKEAEERLAMLSDEEKQIFMLEKLLEKELIKGQLAPQSQLADDRIQLLRDALNWESLTLRNQAADMIEKTLKHLPWSKKNKKQRKQEISQLRQAKKE